MSLAQNDGHGLAKAWIEMGRATPWAEIAAFSADLAALVPKISTASLEDLDFGVTLTAVMQRSTTRGIQTSPMVSILGKFFGNIEGSVRYLAPELSSRSSSRSFGTSYSSWSASSSPRSRRPVPRWRS